MASCCEDKSCALDALRERQGRTLKAVLGINAVMFVLVLGAALVAGSVALLSDSLDNLGDALTYAVSLYAVSRGARAKAKVAVFKGALILAAGLAVAGRSHGSWSTPTCRCSRPWAPRACWPSPPTGCAWCCSPGIATTTST